MDPPYHNTQKSKQKDSCPKCMNYIFFLCGNKYLFFFLTYKLNRERSVKKANNITHTKEVFFNLKLLNFFNLDEIFPLSIMIRLILQK